MLVVVGGMLVVVGGAVVVVGGGGLVVVVGGCAVGVVARAVVVLVGASVVVADAEVVLDKGADVHPAKAATNRRTRPVLSRTSLSLFVSLDILLCSHLPRINGNLLAGYNRRSKRCTVIVDQFC
jgi:hypothetical protein